MLERYEKAANNDVDYIHRLLHDHPELMNVGYTTPPKQLNNNSNQNLLGMLLAPIDIVVDVSVFTICFAANMIWRNRCRERWTLLDFAGERGALDVAILLIRHGANSDDNYFLTLAKQNGHIDFFKACLALKLERAQHLHQIEHLKIYLSEALNEVDRRDAYIASLERQLNSFIPAQVKSGFFAKKVIEYPFGLKDKNNPYKEGDSFLDAFIANAIPNYNDQPWNKRKLRERLAEFYKSNEEFFGETRTREGTMLRLSRKIRDGYEVEETPVTTYESYYKHLLKKGAWLKSFDIYSLCSSYHLCCVIVYANNKKPPKIHGEGFESDKKPPMFVGKNEKGHYVALSCPTNLSPMQVLNDIKDHIQTLRRTI